MSIKYTIYHTYKGQSYFGLYKPSKYCYQFHNFREEFWTIVNGEGMVIIDDKKHYVKCGEFIHIPKKAKHRISNSSKDTELVFIEVQCGEYFGEDDIVRLSDDYNRAS